MRGKNGEQGKRWVSSIDKYISRESMGIKIKDKGSRERMGI